MDQQWHFEGASGDVDENKGTAKKECQVSGFRHGFLARGRDQRFKIQDSRQTRHRHSKLKAHPAMLMKTKEGRNRLRCSLALLLNEHDSEIVMGGIQARGFSCSPDHRITRWPGDPIARPSIKIPGGTFTVVKSIPTQVLRTFAALAVTICMIPGMLLPAQQPAAAQLARHVDPQARQLLDRVIQLLGGQAFLAAKSLTSRGRIFFFQDGRTAGVQSFESRFVYPDKRRFAIAKAKKNISMDTGTVTYDGETKPVILINNGDKGWELDQYGLIAQPDEQLQGWIISNRYSLENLLRLRINEPGVLIQLGKVDFIDNTATQGIEITESGGTRVRLDLHRQTLFPVRVSYRIRNVKENDWDEFSDTYADYRMVDGIQTPMHVTHYLFGDRIGETFRNFAKYNEEYPPNYFTAE